MSTFLFYFYFISVRDGKRHRFRLPLADGPPARQFILFFYFIICYCCYYCYLLFVIIYYLLFYFMLFYFMLFYFMLFYFMLVYLQRERVLSVTNMCHRSTGSPQGLLILFYFLFFILYFKKWQIITPYGINVWYGKIVYLYKENNRRDFQRREWILENKSTPQFFKV